MKPYKKYKPSGIEWIGEIPEHWEVKKLKFVAKVQPSNVDKKSEPDEIPVLLCNYMDVYKNEFINDSLTFMEATATADEIRKFKIAKGDVIVTKDSETPDDIANSTFVSQNFENVVCGYHLTHIRPEPNLLNGEFLFRLFHASPYKDQFQVAANGVTRFGLSSSVFTDAFIPLPPISEQGTIAKFLTAKTSLIDKLITDKQKLIELLKEEKYALINQAVTKGINPKAKMKQSGIEWLGEIPEHWEVKKLKYVVEGKLEYGANEAAELSDHSLPRYIRITDFGDNGKLRDDTFKSLPKEVAKDYLLLNGDILFARSGATVGKTFQFKNYKGEACFAGYLIRARPKLIESDFLFYFTKSRAYENWRDSIFNQATIQNIGADKYNVLEVPIPPKEEQKLLIEFIKSNSSKIDQAISQTEKEITLLQEYRTALISEVVTGKVDVSGL